MSDPAHAPSDHRRHAMTEALRAWDPEAEVTVEADTGRLVVLTTLPADRVATVLKEAEEQGGCGGRAAGSCCGRCSQGSARAVAEAERAR
ncbi:hypothetical protein [Pseudoxanthomonas sp. PXM02]|uniref:hypothetical protein n=1 Tax=Pseudoxanthomonas sp. PXM02 TaxID=2769294 RepID=UPI0017804E23|nr:hypothetical protein [Pseudoxanthomonas sp. PXM02]MBD9478986.1 hypothetical protein [Pseudoxanthomonas sp. PXM02]